MHAYAIEIIRTTLAVAGIRADGPRQAHELFMNAMRDPDFSAEVDALFDLGRGPWEEHHVVDRDDIGKYIERDLTDEAHDAIRRRKEA